MKVLVHTLTIFYLPVIPVSVQRPLAVPLSKFGSMSR